MSFALTTEQMENKTKTVTRRNGWWFLKAGDVVNAVEKAMGLKKGENIKRIGKIRIIDTRKIRVSQIDHEDLIREGLPHMSPAEFVDFFCDSHHGSSPDTIINRIEFEHL
jgi:hypothetical protein